MNQYFSHCKGVKNNVLGRIKGYLTEICHAFQIKLNEVSVPQHRSKDIFMNEASVPQHPKGLYL